MTVEEIFNKLITHVLEGLTYHDDMAQAYDFLGLRGYAMCQNYHHLEETNIYLCIEQYYSKHYHKLLTHLEIKRPEIIPSTWYKYTTLLVDNNTKKNAIKSLIHTWVEWETETKKLYEQLKYELDTIHEVAAAQFLTTLIEDVAKELVYAEQQLIYLESINYDLIPIMDAQDILYKKYKKKLRW